MQQGRRLLTGVESGSMLSPMQGHRLTPNQVVAHNLRRARERRGLTQEQAAELLEPFLGERWSVAVFSAAERSIAGKRVRVFDADTIHAFARAFGLPIGFFFLPPDADALVGLDDASFAPAAASEQISLASLVSDQQRERIDELTRELPFSDRRWLLDLAAADPGGLREDTLLAGAVKRIQAELDILGALVKPEEEGRQ
jgi:transcriptional regulator with XRE-family HTH domain